MSPEQEHMHDRLDYYRKRIERLEARVLKLEKALSTYNDRRYTYRIKQNGQWYAASEAEYERWCGEKRRVRPV